MTEQQIDKLVVPANTKQLGDSLKLLRQYAVSAAEAAGLSKQASGRLRLAVDEIATNIIMYGHPEADSTAQIEATGIINEQTLTLILEDAGVAYNPLEHDLPGQDEISQDLEERDIGGWGIFLTLKNVDEFRYERAANRNRNIFVMNRTAEA